MSAGSPARRPVFLTDDDVRKVFEWKAAIAALASAYGARANASYFPPRTMARGQGFWLRTLSGISPDTGLMGAKLIAASPKNRRASYLIPLFDHDTVELVGLLDGNSITGFRTAATSALAVDRLAGAATKVGLLGSGFEAQKHLRALAAIRPLSDVSVFSPSPESRVRFASAVADLRLPVRCCDSARAVVEQSEILICAARSRDETPLFEGDWLRAGMTVASIGSTLPEQREIDPVSIARADLIVADMPDEIAHDTGDMIAAKEAGIAFADKLVSLASLVSGASVGRTGAQQIIIYKSVGAALQDLTVAGMCLKRAMAQGIGTTLPVTVEPVSK